MPLHQAPTIKNRDVVDYTRVLHRAQLRAIRRVHRYGETDLDEDERLTGQAEDLEKRLALRLQKEIQNFYVSGTGIS